MGTESADLQLACRLADLGAIEKLLQQRPESVNELGESTGWAPLYGAVICRHVRVVKLLLDRGADPNQPTKVGEYPIHQAAESNQAAMLELLLQKGADPDVQQTCKSLYKTEKQHCTLQLPRTTLRYCRYCCATVLTRRSRSGCMDGLRCMWQCWAMRLTRPVVYCSTRQYPPSQTL